MAKTKTLHEYFSERNWVMMVALLGGSISYIGLFGSSIQDTSAQTLRMIALYIFAITIPFQGVYFVIHSYALRYAGKLNSNQTHKVEKVGDICRTIGYLSVLGFAFILLDISIGLGLSFIIAGITCILMVRITWNLPID